MTVTDDPPITITAEELLSLYEQMKVVCENNLYMEYTPIGQVTAVARPACARSRRSCSPTSSPAAGTTWPTRSPRCGT